MSMTQEIIKQKYPLSAIVLDWIKNQYSIKGRNGSGFLLSSGLLVIQIPYNDKKPSKDMWRLGGQVQLEFNNSHHDVKLKKWEIISFIEKDGRKFGTASFVEICIDVGSDDSKGY
jgi:hypothetical protein